MLRRTPVAVLLLILLTVSLNATWLLIPMDRGQANHLRAYGVAFRMLKSGYRCRWLLNYRGGSFLVPKNSASRRAALLAGVTVTDLPAGGYPALKKYIRSRDMNDMLLEKAPRLAVYVPPGQDPWDDAVTLVLEYAGIPFKKIYDPQVLSGDLDRYDWLHIHHEDFTGQYGKFYAFYRHRAWYRLKVKTFRRAAAAAGYPSVAAHKLAVARKIRSYVSRGGFLFAMCSATETLDIALAADGLDIVPSLIDGTPFSPGAQKRLNFKKCFAFRNFILETSAYKYRHSDIDIDVRRLGLHLRRDSFTLFPFSARIDPLPAMLVQNHTRVVSGFLGQTSAFRKPVLKKGITVLGYTPGTQRVRYIHGVLGKGFFSFYSGHDPEDYQHYIGDPPTNLDNYPHSPGYRLILNNILFPVAEKKERKT